MNLEWTSPASWAVWLKMSELSGSRRPRRGSLSRTWILDCARELGCDQAGVAEAHPASSKDRYLAWLAAGYAAEMSYLHEHLDDRFDPSRLLKGARSVIVVGLNYGPGAAHSTDPYRVAAYSRGEDYHRVLRRILRQLRSRLQSEYGGLAARICVDTRPFPDKYWAVEAGLGWQGKHTNVVSRDFGSYLLIGSLIVNRVCDSYDEPHEDFCGTCDACLTACPTSAFPQPYVLDARRCLSYWTIEFQGKELPGPALENPGHWVFGCDDCLDACPWNRFAQPARHASLQSTEELEQVASGRIRNLSEEEFELKFEKTAFMRAGKSRLMRNMAAVESTSQGDRRANAECGA